MNDKLHWENPRRKSTNKRNSKSRKKRYNLNKDDYKSSSDGKYSTIESCRKCIRMSSDYDTQSKAEIVCFTLDLDVAKSNHF